MEGACKNDGAYTGEIKWDILDEKAGVKGLNTYVHFSGFVLPTNKEALLKLGLDYSNDKVKAKQTYDIK